jgi:hypothetical protein
MEPVHFAFHDDVVFEFQRLIHETD